MGRFNLAVVPGPGDAWRFGWGLGLEAQVDRPMSIAGRAPRLPGVPGAENEMLHTLTRVPRLSI